MLLSLGKWEPRELHTILVLLVFLFHTKYANSQKQYNGTFKEIRTACPEGCTQRGNCNAEEGLCECQFGFGGDDCSVPLIPSCMSSLRDGAIPQYGLAFPKNCYCYRQLQHISCSGEFWKDPRVCSHPVFSSWHEVHCYEYPDVPEQQQLSDPHHRGYTGHLVWKSGVRKEGVEGPDAFQLVAAAPAPMRSRGGYQMVPLDRCPNRCGDRGVCVVAGPEPTCACAPFYSGPACERSESTHCPLACSGRGTCQSNGFCHCLPGFWGAGCARSKAYKAAEWTPHPTELRIYVYDLPATVSYMRPSDDGWPLHHSIYLAETDLYQRLLGDTAHRTENPWEANLFYIPTHTYYYTGNLGFPGAHFSSVFRYVREHYPWWNLTGGRNHVAAASNDRGCCDLYRMAPELQHPIKIVHFAQAARPGIPQWRDEYKVTDWGEDPQSMATRLQSDMDDPAVIGAMVEYQHLARRARFKGFPVYEMAALQQEREQCYRPEHDVAFPPYLSATDGNWDKVLKLSYDTLPDGAVRFRRESDRPTLFFFNGYTKDDMAYSAGVRQGLVALFGGSGRPDVQINQGGGVTDMLRSRFCFTPMGFGWGIRLSQAVYAGCVPVMTHDHVWPALWDVLPYERFSVRISRHNLHRLLELLDSITLEQLHKLQDGLTEVLRAFVWQPELGGLAYNYTLMSLHRRLLNMWTAFF